MATALELAEKYIKCDEQVKSLEEDLKAAKEHREMLMDSLAESMVDQDLQSMNYKGKTLYLSTQRSVSYDKDLEEPFFRALKRHKLGDLIRPNINARTLTATVTKELLKEDKHGNMRLPRWIEPYVSIFEKSKVNIRKS